MNETPLSLGLFSVGPCSLPLGQRFYKPTQRRDMESFAVLATDCFSRQSSFC